MGDKNCQKCKLLLELFERTPKSNRDYWVMTKLFVFLHGSDVCSERNDLMAYPKNDSRLKEVGYAKVQKEASYS